MRSARYLLIASSVALLESVFSAPQPQPAQHVFPLCPDPDRTVTFYESHTESHILSILSQYEDPVEAMLSLHPSLEAELAEPRLLQIMDKEGETRWMTEGDKMRLRRAGVDFIDLTGRSGFVYVDAEPNLPDLTRQTQVRKANMFEFLEVFTSYYNRLYTSETGVKSQRWLYDEILDIVRKAPSTCRLSIERFPHSFPQDSIIARFSPSGTRDLSQPVTIIGAHPDSVNLYFPLLNAPGADDNGSGTATILEAFRTLVSVGFEPVHGPVEFHWWAGEEAGLLGSQDVAEEYQRRGIKVGGVLNVDETAFVRANSTPAISLVEVGATQSLNEWVHNLAKEYVDIEVNFSGMIGRRLDHQSWTRHGYPAVSIVEGDQAEGAWLPFPHTVMDRTEIPPAVGEFSYEHMKQFAKVAVAFAFEQAGTVDHNWRPTKAA